MEQLLSMQQRLYGDMRRYQAAERTYRLRWILLEGVILFIGLATPLIVAYRKSGLYPTEFWVWWCTLTPPLAALCVVLMRVTAVQEHCQTSRRRIRRTQHLLSQVDLEIPLCQSDEKATDLLRNWHKESHKIETDA